MKIKPYTPIFIENDKNSNPICQFGEKIIFFNIKSGSIEWEIIEESGIRFCSKKFDVYLKKFYLRTSIHKNWKEIQ